MKVSQRNNNYIPLSSHVCARLYSFLVRVLLDAPADSPIDLTLRSDNSTNIFRLSIIINHLARTFRRRFANHLLPYNYAVGVDGGMDFVIKASQLAVEKYITTPQQSGQAPSRCYISLELKNMFNEISRDKILQVVRDKFPEMLPLVTLLYADPGTVFFRMADGSW